MASVNEKYNGWTNYETWNVKLWIDNDEVSYDYWWEVTGKIINDAELNGQGRDYAARVLADRLENDHIENEPALKGTYGDLMTHALGRVEWYEIAEAMIDDYLDSVER